LIFFFVCLEDEKFIAQCNEICSGKKKSITIIPLKQNTNIKPNILHHHNQLKNTMNENKKNDDTNNNENQNDNDNTNNSDDHESDEEEYTIQNVKIKIIGINLILLDDSRCKTKI
jgi:hypothetical protein